MKYFINSNFFKRRKPNRLIFTIFIILLIVILQLFSFNLNNKLRIYESIKKHYQYLNIESIDQDTANQENVYDELSVYDAKQTRFVY